MPIHALALLMCRMSQDCWEKGVKGWIYKLQQTEGLPKPELSVLLAGEMGLPNGMCWNMV